MSTQGYVKPDFIVSIFSMLWPEFREINNKVILAEEFYQEHYDAKHLMCEVPISELFPDLDFKTQKILGDMMVEMWGAKLKLDFPHMEFVVECYEDEPEDLCCHFLKKSQHRN